MFYRAHLPGNSGARIQCGQECFFRISGLEKGFLERHNVKLLHWHTVPQDIAEDLGYTTLPLSQFLMISQLRLVKNESVKIRGDWTWTADLCPVLERIPLIPTFVGILCPAFKLTDDPFDSTYYSSCREVFAKALVCEYECRISAGPLAILPEEESSQQSCHSCLGTLLKCVQQHSYAAGATMFFNFLDGGRTPIPVPSCQADLFNYPREFVGLHMPNGDIGSMFFVSALMDCGNEVSVDRVEVDVLGEVQLLAGESQSNKVIQERLSCNFSEVITT